MKNHDFWLFVLRSTQISTGICASSFGLFIILAFIKEFLIKGNTENLDHWILASAGLGNLFGIISTIFCVLIFLKIRKEWDF